LSIDDGVVGTVYVHAVVDGFSSYAFGVLGITSRIEPTIVVLDSRVLPFFAERRIAVEAVLTSRLSETSARVRREHLRGKGVEHQICEASRINGFVERFRPSVRHTFAVSDGVSVGHLVNPVTQSDAEPL
jgi:hypothetical protein